MNTCCLLGNLTNSPEVKYTPSGTAICEFSIAINEVFYAGPDGKKEKQERVHYFDCQAWAAMGENIAKFFTKGKPIAITASAKQDRWDDKETGKKRSKVYFRVESWDFAGGDSKKAANQEEPDADPDWNVPPKAKQPAQIVPDDDIPM